MGSSNNIVPISSFQEAEVRSASMHLIIYLLILYISLIPLSCKTVAQFEVQFLYQTLQQKCTEQSVNTTISQFEMPSEI